LKSRATGPLQERISCRIGYKPVPSIINDLQRVSAAPRDMRATLKEQKRTTKTDALALLHRAVRRACRAGGSGASAAAMGMCNFRRSVDSISWHRPNATQAKRTSGHFCGLSLRTRLVRPLSSRALAPPPRHSPPSSFIESRPPTNGATVPTGPQVGLGDQIRKDGCRFFCWPGRDRVYRSLAAASCRIRLARESLAFKHSLDHITQKLPGRSRCQQSSQPRPRPPGNG
jgi:hypothetical protein